MDCALCLSELKHIKSEIRHNAIILSAKQTPDQKKDLQITSWLRCIKKEINKDDKIVPVSLEDMIDSFYSGNAILLLSRKYIPIGYARMIKLPYRSERQYRNKILESTTFFVSKGYRGMHYSYLLRESLLTLEIDKINNKNLVVASTKSIPGIITAKRVYESKGFDVYFSNYSEFPHIATLLFYRRVTARKLTMSQLRKKYLSEQASEHLLNLFNHGKINRNVMETVNLPHIMYINSRKLATDMEEKIQFYNLKQLYIYKTLKNINRSKH